MDVEKPVENPELVAAMKEQGLRPSREAQDHLVACLTRATFLAATVVEEQSGAGEVSLETGSQIRFVSAEQGGKIYLPLFTDWRALTDYTEQKVNGLMLSAADAWDFALKNFDAVVVNPGGDALPLQADLLEFLLAECAHLEGSSSSTLST